jgi:hypothetical protein
MKTKIIIIFLFYTFAPLFAENQIRWDLGINGYMLPSFSYEYYADFDQAIEDAPSNSGMGGPMLPAGDIGLFGQFNFGKWRAGLGFKDISVCFIVNVLYPVVYIEADAGPVTFNLQVGGGAIGIISIFISYYFAGPYMLPEASVWLRLSNKFRLGGGVLVAVTQDIVKESMGKYLKDSSVIFLGFKYLMQSPWV